MGQKQRQKQNEAVRGLTQYILVIFKSGEDIESRQTSVIAE